MCTVLYKKCKNMNVAFGRGAQSRLAVGAFARERWLTQVKTDRR